MQSLTKPAPYAEREKERIKEGKMTDKQKFELSVNVIVLIVVVVLLILGVSVGVTVKYVGGSDEVVGRE